MGRNGRERLPFPRDLVFLVGSRFMTEAGIVILLFIAIAAWKATHHPLPYWIKFAIVSRVDVASTQLT